MPADDKEWVVLNQRQAAFYDQFDTEAGLNFPSRLWRRLRRRVKAAAGVHERAEAVQAEVFATVRPRRLLEVGCYEGREATLALIRQPWLERYLGIELSARALERFRAKLTADESAKVELVVADFLEFELPDRSFDAVYMNGVFHHFRDPRMPIGRVARILVPGGAFVTFDPLITNPLFRATRALYRPFQSDREWEWPLTRDAFAALGEHFELCRVQGFLGMEMYGAMLDAALPLPWTAAMARWGRQVDLEQANRSGRGLFRCNMVAMWWRKSL